MTLLHAPTANTQRTRDATRNRTAHATHHTPHTTTTTTTATTTTPHIAQAPHVSGQRLDNTSRRTHARTSARPSSCHSPNEVDMAQNCGTALPSRGSMRWMARNAVTNPTCRPESSPVLRSDSDSDSVSALLATTTAVTLMVPRLTPGSLVFVSARQR